MTFFARHEPTSRRAAVKRKQTPSTNISLSSARPPRTSMMRLSPPTGISRNSRGTQEITNMKSIRLFSFISLHLNLPVKISFIVLKNSTMRPHMVL